MGRCPPTPATEPPLRSGGWEDGRCTEGSCQGGQPLDKEGLELDPAPALLTLGWVAQEGQPQHSLAFTLTLL